LDQFLALTIMGVVIVIIGIALLLAKKRGGIVLLIGLLWLFTMALYYGLSAAGIYGTPHILNNIIGVIILVVGGALSIYYLNKARRRGGK